MKSEIRGLSIWRPWPWAFLNGPADRRKRIENRDWEPPNWLIGQYLALHAAQHWDKEAIEFIEEQLGVGVPPIDVFEEEHPAGVIFAVAKLARVVEFNPDADIQDVPYDQQGWFFGPVGWLLEDVTAIEPIECKGSRRLWNLSDGVLSIVRDRYIKAKKENKSL